jgi:hypothetical protein
MSDDDSIDRILELLGGDDINFFLTARSAPQGLKVVLSCRYKDCKWGETVGEMELWEFVVDAREYWDKEHSDD